MRVICNVRNEILKIVNSVKRVGYVSAPPIRGCRFGAGLFGAGQFGAGHFGVGTIWHQYFFFRFVFL